MVGGTVVVVVVVVVVGLVAEGEGVVVVDWERDADVVGGGVVVVVGLAVVVALVVVGAAVVVVVVPFPVSVPPLASAKGDVNHYSRIHGPMPESAYGESPVSLLLLPKEGNKLIAVSQKSNFHQTLLY